MAVRPASPSARGACLLLLTSYALLLLAWVLANPPGMSPDEPAHYRKAVALGQGDLLGRAGGYLRLPRPVTASELTWINRTSRAMAVPVSLQGCGEFRLPLEGHCPDDPATRLDRPLPADEEISYVATYPPLIYLLPGLATRAVGAAGGTTIAALLAGRLVLAALCLGLITAAAGLLVGYGGRQAERDRRVWPLAGLVVALSPMVLFVAAELSSSGPEIAAALCLVAAGLRLTRPGPAPRWGLTLLTLSGFVLAASRAPGPGWVVALFVLVAVLRGRAACLAALRRAGLRRAGAMAVVVALGMAATLAWQLVVEPHPAVDPATVVAGIKPALRQLPFVARQAVGIFGWVDVSLPQGLAVVWALLAALLVGLALCVGKRRDRIGLGFALLVALAADIVLDAAVIRPTSPDFKMQGRYVLPILVAVPLCAAEVLHGRAGAVAGLVRRRVRVCVAAAIAVAMAIQGAGWATNAWHYLHAPAFGHEYPARWAPMGGWPVWGALVVVAVLVGWWAAAGLAGSPRPPADPVPDGPAGARGPLAAARPG